MDPAWAVVIGAAIAFLGTLTGSLLTPLVQTRVERRRAQQDRLEEEDRRRYAALGPIFKEWVEAAQAATLAVVVDRGSVDDTVNRLASASHSILLELRTEDEPLIPAISEATRHLTGRLRPGEDLRARAELSSGVLLPLSAWRRGSLTAQQAASSISSFCKQYDQRTAPSSTAQG